MAEQRRYTEEQKQRIVGSGETPPDMELFERIGKNALVGIPRFFTDTASLLGMIKPALDTAVYNTLSSVGLSDDADFATEMYGSEGMKEFGDYVSTRVSDELRKLPPERQTQKNIEAISNHYANTNDARDILLKSGPVLTRMGMQGGNWMNDQIGLKRVEDETIIDDASQIAGGALVTAGVGALTGAAAKSAGKVAIKGATRLATDTAIGVAASQTLRGLTDQPSLYTGDALGADQGVDESYVADADPEAGMGGQTRAAIGAGVGGVALAAAIMAGKANKVASKAAIDSIDVKPRIPSADEKLEPTLSVGQRAKEAFGDSSSPLRSTIRNEYTDLPRSNLNRALDDMDRITANTANVNLNTAHRNAMDLGNIPGLDRKTTRLTLVQRLYSETSPEEQKLFDDTLLAKTLLDRHELTIKSKEDELRDARLGIPIDPATNIRKSKAIEKRLSEMKADTSELMPDMTVKQARELVTRFSANPRLVSMEGMLRKLSSDLLEAAHKDGQITNDGVIKLVKAHPNHMFLQEDATAGLTSSQRILRGLWNQIKGTDQSPMFSNKRVPFKEMEEKVLVKNPMKPIDAYKQYLYDRISFTVENDARRTYVNAMKESPTYKRSIRELGSESLDELSARGGEVPKKFDKANTFSYVEGGRVHYMEAADPETAKALQFNAPATATVWNFARKMFQQGTTGVLRPVFALTAPIYEDAVARTTRKAGRSYGIVDASLRRAFPNSKALSSIMDKIGGSPLGLQSSHLQMLAGVFQQLTMSDMKKYGQAIADDLAANSGIFHWLSQVPGGRQALEFASDNMLRAFNESRYGVFVNQGVKQSSLLDDPLRTVRSGFDAAEYAAKANKPLAHMIHQYKSLLETMHNSSKYAFFAQNLAALERKYGGRDKVPKRELDKLTSETRNLSGDMTRSVGNSTLSKTVSAFPYGQIAINSSYHLASAVRRDPTNVGARIITGQILPAVGAVSLISNIPSLSDWYWNELPAWQRISKIPVIGPDYWMDLAQGKQRELTPNDIYLMPQAPELVPITNSVLAFFRSLGAFGDSPEANASFAKEFGEGLESISSVVTPPPIALIASGAKVDLGRVITSPFTGKPIVEEAYVENPHQGFNKTGINADSDFSRAFANGITNVIGVAFGNLLNSVDVGIQAHEDGDSFDEAFSKAFQFETLQQERSIPEIPGAREAGAYLFTNGQRRMYASTARRERIGKVMDDFEPVAMQLSADNDRSGANARAEDAGLEGLQQIMDPTVRTMAQQMYNTLRKGKMFKLQSDRVDLNKDLVRIEANKERMTPTAYHESVNGIMRQINEVNKEQDEILQMLEGTLQSQYGVDIEGAINTVGQSLGR